MVPRLIRAICASAAVTSFLGGVTGLVIAPNAFFLVPLFAAGVLVVPAMYGGRKPSETDLPRIEEQLHRFRGAMLICFAAAAAVYAVVLTGRGRIQWPRLQELSSLGVALWLAGFVLMFFVAYYSTQRRLATR